MIIENIIDKDLSITERINCVDHYIQIVYYVNDVPFDLSFIYAGRNEQKRSD